MGESLIDGVVSIKRILEDVGGDFTLDSVVKVENEQVQDILPRIVPIPGTNLNAYALQVVAGGVKFCMTLPVPDTIDSPYTLNTNAFLASQNLWKAKDMRMPVSLAGIHTPFNEKGWYELIYVRALSGIFLGYYVRQTLERFTHQVTR